MKNCGIFSENIYKIVRFADTIIIHSSSFIFHYSFIFLQQLQSDKFLFAGAPMKAENLIGDLRTGSGKTPLGLITTRGCFFRMIPAAIMQYCPMGTPKYRPHFYRRSDTGLYIRVTTSSQPRCGIGSRPCRATRRAFCGKGPCSAGRGRSS